MTLDDKIRHAIKLLQSIPQDGPIELSYSGGKDSDVNYLPLSTHPFIDLDMIPDKIYLPKEEIEERKPWIETTYDPNWDECYIRKDALLKMIKERLKLYDPDDPEAETTCYELQSIISWLDGKEVKK